MDLPVQKKDPALVVTPCPKLGPGSHDIQRNDTQHNDIQRNDIEYYDIKHNTTQLNDSQHNYIIII